ncbi:hypothetical protein DFAR_2810048 [Desulfarculales bacterium]
MMPRSGPRAFPVGLSSWPCSFVIWSGLTSYRDICQDFSCCLGKLSHLGVSAAPKRSILSYAN